MLPTIVIFTTIHHTINIPPLSLLPSLSFTSCTIIQSYTIGSPLKVVNLHQNCCKSCHKNLKTAPISLLHLLKIIENDNNCNGSHHIASGQAYIYIILVQLTSFCCTSNRIARSRLCLISYNRLIGAVFMFL